MADKISTELMNQLFSEIEHGWRNRKDRMIVYQLAQKHPDVRDDLYEFFEDLVLGDTDALSPKVAEAEERVARWIQSAGLDLATSAARRERFHTPVTTSSQVNKPAELLTRTTPQIATTHETWISFLRGRVKCGLPDLARALPNMTVEYLVLVSRYPDKVPRAVCKQLAAFVETRWHVPADESLKYLLTSQTVVVRAASRSTPFVDEPANFEALLSRAALSQTQRDFWLQYIDSE
jgi:hypothetical protein